MALETHLTMAESALMQQAWQLAEQERISFREALKKLGADEDQTYAICKEANL